MQKERLEEDGLSLVVVVVWQDGGLNETKTNIRYRTRNTRRTLASGSRLETVAV